MSKPIGLGPSFSKLVVRVIEKPAVRPEPAIIKCQPIEPCKVTCYATKPVRKKMLSTSRKGVRYE